MIQEYKHPLLIGKPCMVHEDFIPSMDLFCRYLELAKCKFWVNSSFRLNSDHIKGAIVKPATHSEHFVGCAVDGNLIDKNNITWSSEKILTEGLSGDILVFVGLVRRCTLLRYGGDFHTEPDPVHYDNALYIKSPARWQEIYNELHNQAA